MAQAVEEIGYGADEEVQGYVRLKVKIDGLKVKSKNLLDDILKKHPLPQGKNATINPPELTEKSFRLSVQGFPDKELQGASFTVTIKQLPYSIDVKKTYLTADNGWIYVFLKKENESTSWERYILKGSLDVAETD